MRLLIATVSLGATHISTGGSVEYAGYMVTGDTCLIVVRDTESKDTSPWLKVGEAWRGKRITAFNELSQQLWTKQVEYGSAPDPLPNGDGPSQRVIEVRARPQSGFASKPFEHLILTLSGKTYRVDWYPGSTHNAPVLSSDREYDFVLTERSFPRLYGSDVWHSIHRVSDSGRVLYDSDVCEVHHVSLTPKYIPTRHGLSRFSPAETDARKHKFPHAESGRAVTCLPIAGEGPITEISICGLCDQAYTEWQKNNAATR